MKTSTFNCGVTYPLPSLNYIRGENQKFAGPEIRISSELYERKHVYRITCSRSMNNREEHAMFLSRDISEL